MPPPDVLRRLSPLLRLVLVVDGIGAAAAAGVWLHDAGRPPQIAVPWLGSWALVAVLVIGTALGELASVRIRRGDTVEEMAFLEAAVVLAAVLLPGRTAVTAVFAGLVAVVAVRRRRRPRSISAPMRPPLRWRSPPPGWWPSQAQASAGDWCSPCSSARSPSTP